MNNIDIKWKNMLSNAKKFYFKNGFHPKRDKNKRLAQWVARQRFLYKNRRLTKEKMQFIEREFPEILKSEQQKKYEDSLSKVVEHLSKKSFDSLDDNLKKWMYHQRDSYRKGILSDEILSKINSIFPDFLEQTSSFGRDEDAWNETLFKVKEYYDKNKCLPKQGTSLRIWINNQRQLFKEDKLSTYRTKLIMKTLPLILDLTHERKSSSSLQELLKTYYLEHKCIPPSTTKEGTWFYEKVRLYKKGKLSQELIMFFKENEIPLLTKSEASWESSFQLITEYYSKYQEFPKEKKLKQWIDLNKKKYNEGTLSEEKIAKIKEALPILFMSDNEKWLMNLKRETDYFIKNNRIRNNAESRWIRNLKKDIINNTLLPWQLAEIKKNIPQVLRIKHQNKKVA